MLVTGLIEGNVPVEGRTFRSQCGCTYRNTFDGTYYVRNTVTGKKVDGRAEISNSHNTDYTWENVLKYDRTFGKHHIDATGLFSVQEMKSTSASQSGEGFVNDDSSFYRRDGAENKITIGSSYWK